MSDLKSNTATAVTVGPFFGSDFVPKLALAVASCHLTLICDPGGIPTLTLDVNATASGGSNDLVHVPGDDAGYYSLELTAANLNYVGRAKLAIVDSANHLPVFHEFDILPPAVYDAKYAGGTTPVDVTKFAGTTQIPGDVVALLTAIAASVDTEVLPASLRTAFGLAAPNLDSQLAGISGKTVNLPADPSSAATVAALIGTVTTKTNNLPNDPADASDIATQFGNVLTAIAAINAFVDTLETVTGQIKAKTDLIVTASLIADAFLMRATQGGADAGVGENSVGDAIAGGLGKWNIDGPSDVMTTRHTDGSVAVTRNLLRSTKGAIASSA